MRTFALALGGGGARGLAHIAVIEALDEMGVKPAAIAGTSIGALVGAAYAAGMRGREIRRHVIGFAHNWAETMRRLFAARAGTLADVFSGGFARATQIDAEKFCAQFLPLQIPADFCGLGIPLKVMATDLHRRAEMPLASGALRTALAASIALPGLLRPVVVNGRVLIDGGTTNPLPFDRLRGGAELVIAVDVLSAPPAERLDIPNVWESIVATINIMGSAIIAEKLAHAPPDLLIRPNVGIFRTLDFARATAILRAADAAKLEVAERLGALLAT
jgi:NTE family protein